MPTLTITRHEVAMALPHDAHRAPPLYVTLVSMATPTVSALENLGYPPSTLARELGFLAGAGMIKSRRDGSIDVVPPHLALASYAAYLEHRAAQARTDTDELTARYEAARSPDTHRPGLQLELLDGLDDLERARWRVVDSAVATLDIVVAPSAANRQIMQALMRADQEPATLPGREDPVYGVTRIPTLRRRLVLDAEALDYAGSVSLLESLAEVGIDVRVHPRVPVSVIVADGQRAIVDFTHLDPSGYGSAVVTNPRLVEVISTVTDSLYAAARPLATPQGEGREGLSAREQRTLALLASGASNTTIARQLRVSERTVERYVATILTELGATSRFQAGVAAARRGWL